MEPQIENEPTIIYVPAAARLDDQAGHLPGIDGYALVVERGPRAGMTFVLPNGVTTVGRHPDADIFLNDVTVSREHCRFELENDQLTIRDIGSTNGTYVGTKRVQTSDLSAGDRVLIGKFHLLVVHGDS